MKKTRKIDETLVNLQNIGISCLSEQLYDISSGPLLFSKVLCACVCAFHKQSPISYENGGHGTLSYLSDWMNQGSD